MPQGRIAGYNAVADLFAKPLLIYRPRKICTCLDLGRAGALYSRLGSQVISQGLAAKKIKYILTRSGFIPR